jgi:hypothetical protein
MPFTSADLLHSTKEWYMVRLREYGFAPICMHAPLFDPAGRAIGCTCWRGTQCDLKNWGKHPVNGGWTEKTQLFRETRKIAGEARLHPNGNIGSATGLATGLVIIDVDVADGKPGLESFARLETECGPLPPTPIVVTGSGGFQYHLSETEIEFKNSAGVIAPGIDIRGKGGVGVLPPSIHRSGNKYQWKEGRVPRDVPIAPLPPAWREMLQSKRAEDPAKQLVLRQRLQERGKYTGTTTEAEEILVLATMMKHPLIEWALEYPDDLNREVWRAIATNFAAPCVDHPTLVPMAQKFFHVISEDHSRYSTRQTDELFQGALDSAQTHGDITFRHMADHGAPEEKCVGGTSLVHAARRAARKGAQR